MCHVSVITYYSFLHHIYIYHNLLHFRIVCCGPTVYADTNECSFYIHALMSPTLLLCVTGQYLSRTKYYKYLTGMNNFIRYRQFLSHSDTVYKFKIIINMRSVTS